MYKHCLHLCLIPSCTTCCCRLPFEENLKLEWHWLHLYLTPSCTDFICLSRPHFQENFESHALHWYFVHTFYVFWGFGNKLTFVHIDYMNIWHFHVLHCSFMGLKVMFMGKFRVTLITSVFYTLMYWLFVGLKVLFVSIFGVTLIALMIINYNSLMYWHFMCFKTSFWSKFRDTLITFIFEALMNY